MRKLFILLVTFLFIGCDSSDSTKKDLDITGATGSSSISMDIDDKNRSLPFIELCFYVNFDHFLLYQDQYKIIITPGEHASYEMDSSYSELCDSQSISIPDTTEGTVISKENLEVYIFGRHYPPDFFILEVGDWINTGNETDRIDLRDYASPTGSIKITININVFKELRYDVNNDNQFTQYDVNRLQEAIDYGYDIYNPEVMFIINSLHRIQGQTQ